MAPSAWAQAPDNDNYLSVDSNQPHAYRPVAAQYRFMQDTTLATVQDDLFLPGAGGRGAEFTMCGDDFGYGKTVWYDFHPPVFDGEFTGSDHGLRHGRRIRRPTPGANAVPFTNEWVCYDDPSPTTVEEISFAVTGGR